MSENASTSQFGEDLLDDDLNELFEECAEEMIADATKKMRRHCLNVMKIEEFRMKCKSGPIKRDFYYTHKTTGLPIDTYIFREIVDVLNMDKSQILDKNTMLFGIYKYEPQSFGHTLYNTTVLNPNIENPCRIRLTVECLEVCPRIGLHVEIFGQMVSSKHGNFIRVQFFNEIPEIYADKFEELLRRNALET